MRQIKYGLIIFISLAFSCKSKAQKNTMLIGKWKGHKTEYRNGSDTNVVGIKIIYNSKWEFTNDSYLITDGIESKKSKFELRGDTIFFKPQNIYYIIEKLDDDNLVVIQLHGLLEIHDYDVREYFKRVNGQHFPQ